MPTSHWPFPGSRWWKFDFHTHTPASLCNGTLSWREAVGTPGEVTPKKWLLKYMAAGMDCVVVTDHNSGAWIDKLKAEYDRMDKSYLIDGKPNGFRELTLFPGIELSVQGGVHVLAVFDPSAGSSDVDALRGSVGYHGTPGDSDAVTSKGIAEVIQAILKAGAIPIPAHVDKPKGLLQCKEGSQASVRDAHTIRQALEVPGLLALEWCAMDAPVPTCVAPLVRGLTRVLGSDCHNFRGAKVPGSHFTWVKMAKPCLEGLRLALLDGNDVSIRRSDTDAGFKPEIPDHVIKSLSIGNARVMGQGKPCELRFSPYFNAIVGGRGTGKSTLVHALRLALGRDDELVEGTEARRNFDRFRGEPRGADSALRSDTRIAVEWLHNNERMRLSWRHDSGTTLVEDWKGQWKPSASQSINPERFPVRIFSQGQISAMAEEGRSNLLRIIDEEAGLGEADNALEDARRTFFTQRAQLREMEARLKHRPEVQRKFDEAKAKLEALTQADHAATLKAFARAKRQKRAVETLQAQIEAMTQAVETAAAALALDDWRDDDFAGAEDMLAWRADVEERIAALRGRLQSEAQQLAAEAHKAQEDPRYTAWMQSVQVADSAYKKLHDELAAKGVSDPDAFARLTREKQQLETRLAELDKAQADHDALNRASVEQLALILQRRQAMTAGRKAFLQEHLASNGWVKMTVRPFGFDAKALEAQLRDLLELSDDVFSGEIGEADDEGGYTGLVGDLLAAEDTVAALQTLKQRLLDVDDGFAGKFRKNLQKKLERPEFADHIEAWYPEDDLQIRYRQGDDWAAISKGSQGQRSAALLAFLLAFGTEPLVLDQPEDDLDNRLIYELIVQQIRANKLRRQLIVVTHNPNIVVNGDAELVHVMDFRSGQCVVKESGALQDKKVREEVCRVMEGGREAFSKRWFRIGREA